MILITLKRYFSHPEKNILKSSLTLRSLCNSRLMCAIRNIEKLLYENGIIENSKDQGSIQPSATPDLGHNMGT